MTTHDEHGPPPDEPGRTEKPSPPATQIDVTVREFAAFVKQTRAVDWANTARDMGWFNLEPPKEKLDHPVTGVSWHDTVAYCAWLSSQTGRRYRISVTRMRGCALGPQAARCRELCPTGCRRALRRG